MGKTLVYEKYWEKQHFCMLNIGDKYLNMRNIGKILVYEKHWEKHFYIYKKNIGKKTFTWVILAKILRYEKHWENKTTISYEKHQQKHHMRDIGKRTFHNRNNWKCFVRIVFKVLFYQTPKSSFKLIYNQHQNNQIFTKLTNVVKSVNENEVTTHKTQ